MYKEVCVNLEKLPFGGRWSNFWRWVCQGTRIFNKKWYN